MSFLLATAAAFVLCLAIEFGLGDVRGAASRKLGDLAVRLCGYGLILLFWFVFSWRPWLAALSCVLTIAVLHLVSRLKRAVIGEPLVFSDFALLPQVPRHPQLYYVPPVTSLRVAGPLLLGSGSRRTLVSLRAEPSARLGRRDFGGRGRLAARPLRPSVRRGSGPLAGWLARRFPQPDLETDLARYGLPACLIALCAAMETRARASCRRRSPDARTGAGRRGRGGDPARILRRSGAARRTAPAADGPDPVPRERVRPPAGPRARRLHHADRTRGPDRGSGRKPSASACSIPTSRPVETSRTASPGPPGGTATPPPSSTPSIATSSGAPA